MHAQELALIDAIRDDPDDDLRRLVYADWLEEEGRAARAELIRAQIAPAHWPDDRERVERAASLIRQHEGEWLSPLLPSPALRFVRGMVELRLETRAGIGVWEDKVAREGLPPWLVECRIELSQYAAADEAVIPFARSALFPHTTRLSLTGIRNDARQDLTSEAAFALAKPSRPSALRSLLVRYADLGVAGTSALARSPHVRLRELDLSHCRLSPRGIAALASAKQLENLTRLVLDGAVGNREALAQLVQGNGLRKLTSLSLAGNQIDEECLHLLLTSRLAEQLTELTLRDNEIGNRGAVALANCAALRHLKYLNLKGNLIGEAGARAILASPILGSQGSLTYTPP